MPRPFCLTSSPTPNPTTIPTPDPDPDPDPDPSLTQAFLFDIVANPRSGLDVDKIDYYQVGFGL